MRDLLKKLHTWCNRHEWLILAVGVVLLLRIPTLFTPHYYGDEEIYFVMGRAWRTGVPMYEAMFDHKPPLIYVLAGITESVFWFRATLMVMMALHTILFWQLVNKFWGKLKSGFLAKLSLVAFVVLTTLPTFEGNIVNAELLMMIPITAALLMVYPEFGKISGRARYKGYSAWRYLAAGLVGGIGWLFKVPVVFDFVAIWLFIFVVSERKFWQGIKNAFSLSSIMFAVGYALPLASSFAYYYLKGHGPSYLDTVFTINLSYVSSWSTSTFAFNPLKSGLIMRGMILALYTLFIYLGRNKISLKLRLALLWAGYSFFGALLSARPYPHYLLEPFVPASLLLPYIFVIEKLYEWVALAVLIFWAVLSNIQIKFWAYDTWSLYRNFGLYVTGKISSSDYLNSFDGARRNYALQDYIAPRLESGEQIFVWGSDTTLYNLLDRLPSGGKYMVDFHVRDFGAQDLVIENLERNNPKFVVVLPGSVELPRLPSFLAREYVETTEIEGARVYMRLGSSQ